MIKLNHTLIKKNFYANFSQDSTDECLIHLTDFIKFQMYKGHFVRMVLLNLQKAFDTVDHNILLMKLEALGLSQDSIHIFHIGNSLFMDLVLCLHILK